MKDFPFPLKITIFTHGCSPEELADIVSSAVGGSACVFRESGKTKKCLVTDKFEKTWEITPCYRVNDQEPNRNALRSSPLYLGNLFLLKEVLDEIKGRFYCPCDSSELLIDFYYLYFDAEYLTNALKIFYTNYETILKAMKINRDDNFGYGPIPDSIIHSIEQKPPQTLNELEEIWYKGDCKDDRYSEMHMSSLCILDLHAVFRNQVLGFRTPIETFEPKEVVSFIHLFLAIVYKAFFRMTYEESKLLNFKDTSGNIYAFLDFLGLHEPDYKETRDHFLKTPT